MSKIYSSVTELVAHTPLIEFNRLAKVLGIKDRVVGKVVRIFVDNTNCQ